MNLLWFREINNEKIRDNFQIKTNLNNCSHHTSWHFACTHLLRVSRAWIVNFFHTSSCSSAFLFAHVIHSFVLILFVLTLNFYRVQLICFHFFYYYLFLTSANESFCTELNVWCNFRCFVRSRLLFVFKFHFIVSETQENNNKIQSETKWATGCNKCFNPPSQQSIKNVPSSASSEIHLISRIVYLRNANYISARADQYWISSFAITKYMSWMSLI